MKLFRWLVHHPYWLLQAVVSDKAGLRYENAALALGNKTACDTQARVDAHYRLLTVLDQKASALMRLDGVLVAAAAVILTENDGRLAEWQLGAQWMAALAGLAIFFCLQVISIDWSFLSLSRVTSTTRTEEKNGQAVSVEEYKFDFSDELVHLRKVGSLRTFLYRCAWILTYAAGIVIVWVFVSELLGK